MNALKAALLNRLVAANVNGGSGIFDTLAPHSQAYPYVLFQYISGGDINLSPLVVRDEQWQVKAVTDNHEEAGLLADDIRDALHHQALTISGWQHMDSIQVGHVWLVESQARGVIYHAGGTFRIRFYKT